GCHFTTHFDKRESCCFSGAGGERSHKVKDILHASCKPEGFGRVCVPFVRVAAGPGSLDTAFRGAAAGTVAATRGIDGPTRETRRRDLFKRNSGRTILSSAQNAHSGFDVRPTFPFGVARPWPDTLNGSRWRHRPTDRSSRGEVPPM